MSSSNSIHKGSNQKKHSKRIFKLENFTLPIPPPLESITCRDQAGGLALSHPDSAHLGGGAESTVAAVRGRSFTDLDGVEVVDNEIDVRRTAPCAGALAASDGAAPRLSRV